MKVLFVSGDDYNDVMFGGGKGANSRYRLIESMFQTYPLNVKKKSNIYSLISILEHHFPAMDNQYLREIKEIINKEQIDVIFFDASTFGLAIKKIKLKTPDVKIISHFNNCEYDYIDVRFGECKSLKKMIYKKLVHFNEELTLKYSDCTISLSKRDSTRVSEVYGIPTSNIIPLFIHDEARPEDLIPVDNGYCLLFGPVGTANIEGFSWFVENVSPFINVKTVIAGKGFERYKEKFSGRNINVIGYTKDIHELYKDAFCVCIPIFSGGGMKIKTVEALMFGKNIIGTEEAFSGYEFEYDKVGGIANNAKEFIDIINSLSEKDIPSYNNHSRKVYIEKYSDVNAKKVFSNIINLFN